MIDIKKNLKALNNNGYLFGKTIVIVSADGYMYEAAKELVSNGISPYMLDIVNTGGIFSNTFKKISFKELKREGNFVILLSENEFYSFRLLFERENFKINRDILIDCKKQGPIFFIKDIKHKLIILKRNLEGLIFSISQLTISNIYFFIGKRIYRQILTLFGKGNVYIYDYSGIGDVFVLSLFLKEKEKKELKKEILIVKSQICKRVANYVGIQNILTLSERKCKLLTYYARIPNNENGEISVITPFPRRIHTDIYSHYLYGKKMSMADAYRCVMFNLPSTDIEYPNAKNCNSNELTFDNQIIISPYANTIIGYPMWFWENVAYQLKKEGFHVLTNVAQNEKEILGTGRAEYPLEEAETVINNAGFFLALRSGFCDVICNSSAYKCIIYPEYHIFNSSVYDFCSFTKMKLGRNIDEIRWDYDQLDILIGLIVKKFKHARYARQFQGDNNL